MPSCRSRRSRRRSSSRAWTSRAREALSASARPAAATAAPAGRARSVSSCRSRGREGPAVATLQQQPPDPLALVVQRQLVQRAAARLAGVGPLAGRGLDRHVGQPQGVRDGLGEGGQRGAGRRGGLQPGGQPGQRGVGIAAVAVHRPVDQPLQPGPQGQHECADDADGHGAGPGVGGQRPAERPDQRRVQRDDRGRQARRRPATG